MDEAAANGSTSKKSGRSEGTKFELCGRTGGSRSWSEDRPPHLRLYLCEPTVRSV